MFPSHTLAPQSHHTHCAPPPGPRNPRPDLAHLRSLRGASRPETPPPPRGPPDLRNPLLTSTPRRPRPTDLPGGGAGVQTGRGLRWPRRLRKAGQVLRDPAPRTRRKARPGPRRAAASEGQGRGAGRGGERGSRGHRPQPGRAALLRPPALPAPQPPRFSATAGCKAQAPAGGRQRGRRGLLGAGSRSGEGPLEGAGQVEQGLWWWAGPKGIWRVWVCRVGGDLR